MKSKDKKLTEHAEQLLKERGTKALETAKKVILKEKLACKEVSEAIKFFTEYWHDLARPTLISICCDAVGGKPDSTVPVAASMTLICGATDIHDDIIDNSERKLSRSTIFGKFGKDIALLVGDALLFKGFLLLNNSCKNIPPKRTAQICSVISNMFFEMGDAEALELKLRGRMDVTPEESLSVIKMKAADIEACARIGAIIGNGSKKEIDALGKYGRMFGTILVLRDDLADTADYEEASHRIKNEQLPLPIVLTLQNPETRAKISPFVLKEKIEKKDVKRIFEIVSEAGSVQKLTEVINGMRSNACSYTEGMPNRKYLTMLIDAATFL
jgi:geranylgeranyl pyrophosphate synthase